MGASNSKNPLPPAVPASGVYADVRAARNYTHSSKTFTVYEIHLQKDHFTWVVTKRFSEICRFHSQCKNLHGFTLTRPPKTFRRHASAKFVASRLAQLRNYFAGAFARVDVWQSEFAREFAEVSRQSFDWKLGKKGKEGWLYKRSGGRMNMSNSVLSNWRRRWFVVKDACVAYYESRESEDPKGVMLIDDAFEVRALTNTIIQLSNRTRRLMVRTRSYRASCEWTEALSRRFMHNQRKVAHPYGSFSPVRHYSPAAWYVDGAAAFAAMAKAMEEAEEQIFISGWWLSPDVQLIRSRPWQRQANGEPCGIDVRVRLLDIIWRKQCCGVKIYVLLYKEVGIGVMANDSSGAKARLLALGHQKNVFVIRHPNHLSISSGALYWTHHDKVVVVDQKLAFLGGVDLCYGRYDNWRHQLSDRSEAAEALWPGDDFYNPCAAEAVTTTRRALLRAALQTSTGQAIALGMQAARNAARQLVGELARAAPTNSPAYTTGAVVPVPNLDREDMDQQAAVDAKQAEETAGAAVAGAAVVPPPPPTPPHEGVTRTTSGLAATHGSPPTAPPPPPPRPHLGRTVSDPEAVTEEERKEMMRIFPPPRATQESTASGYTLKCHSNRLPDPETHPRLPWHDIHMCVSGPAAVDLAFHFIQRWNHHRLTKGEDSQPWLLPRSDETGWWVHGASAVGQRRSAARSVARQGLQPLTPQGGAQAQQGAEGMSAPRSPDTTGGEGEYKQSSSAVGLGELQTPVAGRMERTPRLPLSHAPEQSGAPPPLADVASEGDVATTDVATTQGRATVVAPALISIRYSASLPSMVKPWDAATCEAISNALMDSSCAFNECSVQILRSISPWSAGVPRESSIHACMLELIQNARHFIYIENQYFISSVGENGVKNGIVDALLSRIKQAIDKSERFRVIIVLPCHPEGDHHTNRSVQSVLHNMFATICRGETSLFGTLKSMYPDVVPSEYISFYSLRTEGSLPSGARVTEQVYVHSKLMIVDDCVALIGSANINDRSLQGDRDSEVMALVVDSQVVPSRMGGAPWQARGFAWTLRMRLWRQHLGLMEAPWDAVDLADPIAPDTYFGVWMKTALDNTKYYEHVYPGVAQLTGLLPRAPPPTPRRRHFHNVFCMNKSYQAALLPEVASAERSAPASDAGLPRGLLVCFSFAFREGEDLRPDPLSAEGLTPARVFQ